MQICRNVIQLAISNGSGNSATVKSLLLAKTLSPKQINRNLTATTNQLSNKCAETNVNKDYRRTIKTTITTGGLNQHNHISYRQQSTTQTKLAASQLQPIFKEESTARLVVEDDDYEKLQHQQIEDYFFGQDDNLIYE